MIKKEETKKFESIEELDKHLGRDKPWYWYNHCWYWIRHGIWNWLTDLKWRIPTWWHRSFHGWGYADTWGLDFYLSKVLYESLTYLKKHNHGYPVTIRPENPKDPNDFDSKANEEAWDKIMDKMIKTFELARHIGDTIYYFPSDEWDEKTYQTYIGLCKDFNRKWPGDKYRTMTLEESKEFEEGFDLFKKHFFNLWD